MMDAFHDEFDNMLDGFLKKVENLKNDAEFVVARDDNNKILLNLFRKFILKVCLFQTYLLYL